MKKVAEGLIVAWAFIVMIFFMFPIVATVILWAWEWWVKDFTKKGW
jgi:hypothetical protein